jgi:hypothetical protein
MTGLSANLIFAYLGMPTPDPHQQQQHAHGIAKLLSITAAFAPTCACNIQAPEIERYFGLAQYRAWQAVVQQYY